ncbi:hypothetical protein GPECTOR_59g675 [Gonium pectorale]|uniref:Uncharacterized protein n=1 Tax=Gonium pectorale TaxID=33097 RepID=A0A150G5A2_GONPE|nr:hypothetical protein GPECTOR_59g675 [Gonium pectorale]|eukprot:KXZ45066.1 hypothetical protein GPECTOR_59g675 [Gonium pectorale]
MLLDADLAVLGSSPQQYSRYSNGISLEYASLYGPYEYAAGRSRVLRSFLARPQLFFTAAGRRLEGQARANLEAELRELGHTGEAPLAPDGPGAAAPPPSEPPQGA